MTTNPGPLPPGLGDPVPTPSSPTTPEPQPQPDGGEQNADYANDTNDGVDDELAEQAAG